MNRNQDIRRAAKDAGVKLWEIAEAIGISSAWLSVRLRKELTPDEKAEILAIIYRLSGRESA